MAHIVDTEVETGELHSNLYEKGGSRRNHEPSKEPQSQTKMKKKTMLLLIQDQKKDPLLIQENIEELKPISIKKKGTKSN